MVNASIVTDRCFVWICVKLLPPELYLKTQKHNSHQTVLPSPRSPLSGYLYRDVTWGTESLYPFKYSGIWLNLTGA